jgi:hypothetical protein
MEPGTALGDIESLGRIPVLDESALEVLRAQEGVGLDRPPQTVIFTDSLSAKAVAENLQQRSTGSPAPREPRSSGAGYGGP